jgi:transcription initiation factor TFIIIB Brf1 subunit/transcription initiation factor TFIIB
MLALAKSAAAKHAVVKPPASAASNEAPPAVGGDGDDEGVVRRRARGSLRAARAVEFAVRLSGIVCRMGLGADVIEQAVATVRAYDEAEEAKRRAPDCPPRQRARLASQATNRPTDELLAACVYVAASRLRYGVTPLEASDAAGVNRTRMARAARAVIQAITGAPQGPCQIKTQPAPQPAQILEGGGGGAAGRGDVDRSKEAVVRMARKLGLADNEDLVNRMCWSAAHIRGSHPLLECRWSESLAALAVYANALRAGSPVALDQVASAAGVSAGTLKHLWGVAAGVQDNFLLPPST